MRYVSNECPMIWTTHQIRKGILDSTSYHHHARPLTGQLAASHFDTYYVSPVYLICPLIIAHQHYSALDMARKRKYNSSPERREAIRASKMAWYNECVLRSSIS